MLVQFLGGEDPQGKRISTHASILAWRIPWAEEPGRLQCRIQLKDLACTFQAALHPLLLCSGIMVPLGALNAMPGR